LRGEVAKWGGRMTRKNSRSNRVLWPKFAGGQVDLELKKRT